MWNRPRLELAVPAGAVLVLFLALAADVVRWAHVLSLFTTYVVSTVVAVVLVDTDRSPGLVDAVSLAVVIALVVGVPVAYSVGHPPAPVDRPMLHVVRFAGQWALPVALTVPFGLLDTNVRRVPFLLAHPVALAGLLWLAAELYGASGSPLWVLSSLTTAQYVVGVVVSAPAALLLARRRSIASVIPK